MAALAAQMSDLQKGEHAVRDEQAELARKVSCPLSYICDRNIIIRRHSRINLLLRRLRTCGLRLMLNFVRNRNVVAWALETVSSIQWTAATCGTMLSRHLDVVKFSDEASRRLQLELYTKFIRVNSYSGL